MQSRLAFSRITSACIALIAMAPWVLADPVLADSVNVKYRGPVDLKSFSCRDVTSSFVRRICFDKAQQYMLIDLSGTWYHYCEIDASTVDALVTASSVGSFYNQRIKGSGNDGPFDCRTHKVPRY
jgi:hypothetical protein